MPTASPPRLLWLDMARGVALLAMVVYHFVFDLELFGHLPRGTAISPPWAAFAKGIAASFLFLAGLSLWLAHGQGIRWRAFGHRFLKLAGAAGLISLATYLAMPQGFIFFGILHAIAAFSLIGLAFLRLPMAGVLFLSAGVLTLGPSLSHPVFDHPALLWTGLSPRIPATMDFEPLFPWFAPFLAGMAAGRLLPANWPTPRYATGLQLALGWAGRHSLVVYLLHQPVLIALIWVVSRLN